jgi:hypothetical protein
VYFNIMATRQKTIINNPFAFIVLCILGINPERSKYCQHEYCYSVLKTFAFRELFSILAKFSIKVHKPYENFLLPAH